MTIWIVFRKDAIGQEWAEYGSSDELQARDRMHELEDEKPMYSFEIRQKIMVAV